MPTSTQTRSVLISQPQLAEFGVPYLPIMWGVLKTYWEQHGAHPDAVTWLDPIGKMAPVDELLERVGDAPIDVLGLSCYTWNWRLQCALAAEVKRRHPHCLVVAGGPEPDYKDPAFFEKHPYIDVVAVKDGEITFNGILQRVVEADDMGALLADRGAAFGHIRGLYMPNPDGGSHLCTGPAEIPTTFDTSPLLAQRSFYEKMLAACDSLAVVVWETNRGCPYSCAYCDWGSNTMSKLRQFSLERVKAEIEWFGRMKLHSVLCADANFGILPRDVEIAERVADCRRRTGYPQSFSYNTAKNNPGRTVAVAKVFTEVGLMSGYNVSVQHTDPEVLAATKRDNIRIDKQYAAARQLMTENALSVFCQLILGIPGDTLAKWKRCFPDLMEEGMHAYYWIFPYNLLPNAPASDRENLERWQVRTIERYFLLNYGTRSNSPSDSVAKVRSRLIVGCTSFSESDWVDMMAYASQIKALHSSGITELVAMYLRFTHNVPYAAFYDDLFTHFLSTDASPTGAWFEEMRATFQEYLDRPDALGFMHVPGLSDDALQLEPARWLLAMLAMHRDAFYDALTPYLCGRYPQAEALQSVLQWSRNVLITTDYDARAGKRFTIDHDWPAWFSAARQALTYRPLGEPEALPTGTVAEVSDTGSTDGGSVLELDWGKGPAWRRWERWVALMATGRTASSKNTFQQVQVRPPTGVLAQPAGSR